MTTPIYFLRNHNQVIKPHSAKILSSLNHTKKTFWSELHQIKSAIFRVKKTLNFNIR